jgi:LPXTG-motif cell wall-anchored protein
VTNYPVSWYVNKSTVEGASNSNIAQITNKKGISLPGTGGIGTTIFTFGGLALVLVAAVMFIVYIKKQKKQA